MTQGGYTGIDGRVSIERGGGGSSSFWDFFFSRMMGNRAFLKSVGTPPSKEWG